MASKNYGAQKAGWSQADQRSYATFYDQHKSARFPQGRPWWAVVERAAEGAAMPGPVGELQPKDWVAPWYPPAEFVNRSVGKATPGNEMNTHHFRIDYVSLINQQKAALRQYYDNAVIEATGQGWPAPNYGDPITFRLRAIIGKAPPLSPKIPEAALAEDPYILGFSNVENEALARLLAHGMEDVETAPQSEKKVDEMSELKAQIAALVERDRARDADSEAKAQAARDRMAKARAGKKPQTASAR